MPPGYYDGRGRTHFPYIKALGHTTLQSKICPPRAELIPQLISALKPPTAYYIGIHVKTSTTAPRHARHLLDELDPLDKLERRSRP